MKNFIQPGNTLAVKAPHAVKSGDLLVLGALRGVAVNDASTGENLELVTSGVFVLPKKKQESCEVGSLAYFKDSKVTSTAEGQPVGFFVMSSEASEAACAVKLL